MRHTRDQSARQISKMIATSQNLDTNIGRKSTRRKGRNVCSREKRDTCDFPENSKNAKMAVQTQVLRSFASNFFHVTERTFKKIKWICLKPRSDDDQDCVKQPARPSVNWTGKAWEAF